MLSSARAAFFDLDRTLISRPTPVALAATFRKRGLLRKRDLLRATLWQLAFMLPGIDGTRRASVEGMSLLRGLPVSSLQELLGEAMEDALRPLIFADPLELLKRHREDGERTYIISASLQEIKPASDPGQTKPLSRLDVAPRHVGQSFSSRRAAV